VARRALLPGNRGLAGLFHEAAQAYLGCAQELGIVGLHEGREEHIQRAIHSRTGEDAIGNRIGLSYRKVFFVIRIRK